MSLSRIATASIFFLLTITQLAYDPDNLPLGFEAAKVRLIQLIGALCLAVISLQLAQLIRSGKSAIDLSKPRLVLVGMGLLLYLIILLGAITSPYPELMLTGSIYRFTGIFTLTALFSIYSYFCLNYKTKFWRDFLYIYIVVLSFQAFLGLLDATRLTWEEIGLGFYVNGNYGQANFFADTMTVGLCLSLFYLTRRKFNKITSIVKIILILLFASTIFLSFSTAGWINIAFFSALIMLGLLRKVRLSYYLTLVAIYGVSTIVYVYQHDESRHLFWDSVLSLIFLRPLLGYGSDTLSYAFQQHSLLVGRLVDRAHNFYLDYVYNFGLLATIPIFIWGVWGYRQIRKIRWNKELSAITLVLGVFFLSGLVHTKSIYHYAELCAWSALLLVHLLSASKLSRN